MSSELSLIIHSDDDQYGDIPKESIGKYFYNCLKNQNRDKVIHVDAVTNISLTRGNLLELSVKFAEVLKTFSIEQNDTIAIISANSINYTVPILSSFYLGVIAGLLNPSYSTGELIHALEILKPKLIICSEEVLDQILALKEQVEFTNHIILLERNSDKNCDYKSVEDFSQSLKMNVDSFQPVEFDYTEQGALVLLSSGTTGLPKGVLLTHENLRGAMSYPTNPKYLNLRENDVLPCFVPLCHILGLGFLMGAVPGGYKMVIIKQFSPALFLNSIETYKATQLVLVPSVLLFLVRTPLLEKYDISSLKYISVGAASVGSNLHEEANEKLPFITIRQFYGTTETTGLCTYQTVNIKNTPGSVGVLVPGLSAKIKCIETKTTLGPLEVGEICFKGSVVMKKYFGNEAATQDSIDDEGFYCTGDVGYYDEKNIFYVVDRIKELIKYKGFQVPPAELESIILSHPNVKECGVIGIPNERSGQLAMAFVVKKTDANLCEQDVIDYVAERISVEKRLYGGVKFLNEIPKNSTGKILRKKLSEIAAADKQLTNQ